MGYSLLIKLYTEAWRLWGCQGVLLLWMWPSNKLWTCGFVVVTEGSRVFIAECRGDCYLYGHHNPLFQHGIHVSPSHIYEACVPKLLRKVGALVNLYRVTLEHEVLHEEQVLQTLYMQAVVCFSGPETLTEKWSGILPTDCSMKWPPQSYPL